MRRGNRVLALLLSVCLLLSCAACGGGTLATSMRLVKTQGTVDIVNDLGRSVTPRADLGLYSGYRVDTAEASYAWIDLDDVKLTKMDEHSEIEIQKDGKKLRVEVLSGSLFFNVTQPLADDEELNICTSTMMVGIRGTCGWVRTSDPDHMEVWLLEGTVECTAGGANVTVNAGEMASMTSDGHIAVRSFDRDQAPAFVREELDAEDIPDGFADVLAEIDGELLYAERVDFEGDGVPELLAFCREIIYGDPLGISVRIYREQGGQISMIDAYYLEVEQGEELRFSLAGSAVDNRVFLCRQRTLVNPNNRENINYFEYYNTIITEWGQTYMWAVDQFQSTVNGTNSAVYARAVYGQDEQWREVTATEYEAGREDYSETQFICLVSRDGVTWGTPGSGSDTPAPPTPSAPSGGGFSLADRLEELTNLP